MSDPLYVPDLLFGRGRDFRILLFARSPANLLNITAPRSVGDFFLLLFFFYLMQVQLGSVLNSLQYGSRGLYYKAVNCVGTWEPKCGEARARGRRAGGTAADRRHRMDGDGDGHGREGGHVCPPLPVRRGRRRRIRGQVKCVKKKTLDFLMILWRLLW